MSDELPPVRCDDDSTWRHKGEQIHLFTLGGLLETNGGPDGLDLHGANLAGIDLSLEALKAAAPAMGLKWLSWWVMRGHAELPGAHLERARLISAHMEGADLKSAQLQKADLTGSQLQGGDLEGAQLQGTNLSRAHLHRANLQQASLELANLDGADVSQANLRGANLQSANLLHTDLQSVALQGANLSNARITHSDLAGAILIHAHLEGALIHYAALQNASLKYARMQDAALEGSHLEGVDISDSYVLGVHWYGAFLDRTRIRRDQLGDAIGDELRANDHKTAQAYREASEAYLLLKNNFNSIGRYEDAAWAHIKEQQMEKMTCFHDWRSSLRKNWFSFLRWLRNWAFELLTGYGERAWMPVLWALAVILGFALGYAAAGNVSPNFAGDPATAHTSHNFLDALTHSIGAFATIGFNTLEPIGWGARLLTAIESAFGIGLFALFIFTLGNRMSRS